MKPPPLGLWTQSLLYLAAGLNHFWHKRAYLPLMPTHYSHPAPLIALSGAAEIAGGLGLLVPATRRASAVSLAVLLVIFLDVHVSMLKHPERFPGIPVWALWLRLPLQAVLIGWALRYSRQPAGRPVRSTA